jgi:hypothetical protein
VSSGLTWMRHRQRRLGRALLAAFGLVWLQLAAVPCFAAHDADPGQPGVHDPQSDAGCPYCPAKADLPGPSHCGDGGDNGGDCAFPHDPQVDVRGASSLPPPLAGGWSFPLLAAQAAVRVESAGDRPESIPRRSLSVRYCRFIE